MANLKDIRRRINSVKSTQKITNALKLVSAAKFARASHAIQSARPYSEALDRLVENVLLSQDREVSVDLLEKRSESRALLVLVGTDRGQCGALNNNLFKKAKTFVQEKESAGVVVDVMACGRRSIMFAKKFGRTIFDQQEKVLEKPDYNSAMSLIDSLLPIFRGAQYDKVYFAYNAYKSALVQTPSILQLLPIEPEISENTRLQAKDYIIEPDLKEMLGPLLMKKVTATVFRVLLDGAASEHGARMTAMDSATKNAKEVIRKLTLQYNRARQAAITKELIEIVSGAEALN